MRTIYTQVLDVALGFGKYNSIYSNLCNNDAIKGAGRTKMAEQVGLASD